MPEVSERDTIIVERSAVDASERLAKASKHAQDIMMGAQRVVLEEVVFISNELLDRAMTEMHLLSEFISKMAGSHSVKNLRTMYEECSRHQIDFIRRDSERLFRHGERMLETASKLLGQQPRI